MVALSSIFDCWFYNPKLSDLKINSEISRGKNRRYNAKLISDWELGVS